MLKLLVRDIMSIRNSLTPFTGVTALSTSDQSTRLLRTRLPTTSVSDSTNELLFVKISLIGLIWKTVPLVENPWLEETKIDFF